MIRDAREEQNDPVPEDRRRPDPVQSDGSARSPKAEIAAHGIAEICGVPVHAVSLHDAVRMLIASALARESLVAHLCNAYVLSLAGRDVEYRRILSHGDLNLADGAPVAWKLQRLRLPLQGARPSGPDLFEATLAGSEIADVSHFLYGSSPTAMEALRTHIGRSWPGAEIAAAESPPYRELTATEYGGLVQRIRSSGPTIVWVAIGTPKQDLLVDRLRHDCDAVLVPVGAAFDFLAGEKRRAPRRMRRAGLEWLFRFASEPRRLWRRYLVGNVTFAWCVRSARVLRPRVPGPAQGSGSRHR